MPGTEAKPEALPQHRQARREPGDGRELTNAVPLAIIPPER